MSEILDALDHLARQTWKHDWQNPAIKQFVESGDERLLNSITNLERPWFTLERAVPSPSEWTGEAGRLLRLAVLHDVDGLYRSWLCRFCRRGTLDWSQFDAAVELLRRAGATEEQILKSIAGSELWRDEANELTQAGRLALSSSNDLLMSCMGETWHRVQLMFILARCQPDRLVEMLESAKAGLEFHDEGGLLAMLNGNPGKFHERVFSAAKEIRGDHQLVVVGRALFRAQPELYRDWAMRQCKGVFERTNADHLQGFCCNLLIEVNDSDAFAVTRRWMATFTSPHTWGAASQREGVLKNLLANHPEEVAVAAECATQCPVGSVVLLGLRYWRNHGIGDAKERFHAALKRALANPEVSTVVSAISEAASWDLRGTQEDLWPLLQHKSRPVREVAARSLAGLGQPQAGERAANLLQHKKADVRLAAVTLLEHLGTHEALSALKRWLDTEDNDGVRDAILLALQRSGGGVALTPDELSARIAKTLAKAKSLPVSWLDPAKLPFRRRDGSMLTPEEVSYLLIRQSRCKEMRADIEANLLYATLDRSANGATALSTLQAFIGSDQSADDRWVMALAVLTGDDRLVPVLHRAIIEWADKARGKLAEYGGQALALLGTDAALMVVDSLSVRFRSKNKNIGKAASEAFAAAAEARGVTVEELGDLVVPWLGFEPGKPRVIAAGKTQFEVRISNEFKLTFRDLATGKKVAKPPSSAGAEMLAEFKALAGTLKEAAKAQHLRIETLLVRQFQWPVGRWRNLYQNHPLLRPFSERLIWSWRDADGRIAYTFRALDDGSLTDASDEQVTLPEVGTVAIVHPLELEASQRTAWLKHLADYDVVPPFSQLDRPVVQVQESETGVRFGKIVTGTQINAMTFRGRAEKFGWTRGSVVDAGYVSGYRKLFSGAGIQAFLNLEGLYIGIGTDETITLGDVFFVEADAVKIGSYVYDEPGKEDDPRLIPFGKVPAVSFSETMGDLAKISGKTLSPEAPGTPDDS